MNNQLQYPLADMGFERVLPSPLLRPFVQWFWAMKSAGDVYTQRDEFMHPDGSLGILFNWGDTLELSNGRYPQTVILDKVTPHSMRLQLAGQIDLFGILFRPGGAFPIFGMPLSELPDATSLLAASVSKDLFQLYEQLSETITMVERVVLVEQWLTARLAEAQAQSPVLHPTLQMIAQMQGQLSVPDLADAVHLSTRQLERVYRQQVGLSPKKMARLHRVRQARTALKQMEDQSQVETPSQAEVAYMCGYYDQAHFIREFKAVTGLTPGAYLKRHQERTVLLNKE